MCKKIKPGIGNYHHMVIAFEVQFNCSLFSGAKF